MPNLILAIVFSFMFLVFEPITMYASNINDFWFDIYAMFPHVLLSFIAAVIGIFVVLTIIQKIHEKTYYFVILAGFAIFFASYIQGNYLAGSLPALDGTTIDWSAFTVETIISVIVWLIIIAGFVFLTLKFKSKAVIKYSTYASLAVFVMLSVSLISTIASNPVFMHKVSNITTNKNYHLASTDKNYFIFMVDAVDAGSFEEANSDSPTYKDTFADFTFYKDSISGYPYTRDSVPMIFSGEWNENATNFQTYSTKAYTNSKLLKGVASAGYTINFYDTELVWNDSDARSIISNLQVSSTLGRKNFYGQIAKYIIFRYAPFPLKPLSKIETLEFKTNSPTAYTFENAEYNWDSGHNYHLLKDNKIETTSNKVFHFVHTEGAHVPFDYDADFNKIENGTYRMKLQATYTLIKTYLDRLRESNVYDNSVIIIMSDHGYNPTNSAQGYFRRQNALLYIKGLGEKHDLKISDQPISYIDLSDAFVDLLNGKKTSEIFEGISYPRTRRYLFYEYTKEDHMIEYETDGKAWETEKLNRTGKEYNR